MLYFLFYVILQIFLRLCLTNNLNLFPLINYFSASFYMYYYKTEENITLLNMYIIKRGVITLIAKDTVRKIFI